MLGKHLLRLDALPVLQPAEIRNDRQFPDAALRLKCLTCRITFSGVPMNPISWSTISLVSQFGSDSSAPLA